MIVQLVAPSVSKGRRPVAARFMFLLALAALVAPTVIL